MLPIRSLALTALALCGGCSAELANDAPVIDSAESPIRVTAAGGTYRIPLTVLFHDDDGEAVTGVRYRVEGGAKTTSEGLIAIRSPIPTRDSADVVIVVPVHECAPSPSAALTIRIIDGRGAESQPIALTLTLTPEPSPASAPN